ncbi:sulfatase-like hydrolase/transferase [Flavivirga abyssicola]|uniref:sulfatase-like hydrolase/transferase n=1 Tax=Flavivirga abyssicola TaxID=3063533 RepID=UPI0026E00933|nr:sulfatase-like hydrolase/transferase [Flavivirga sp. MEBiC07777]WVK11981.1 sulfatase-like hydrolase/transferase [Flavivirga sp. MEBiC07777]
MISIRGLSKTLVIITTVFFMQNALAQKKPNVLIIYTDDHRFSGVHALGGMDVKTPNIDTLADDGIAFTNTYLMGAFSGATCIPSRAMLFSGRHLFKLKGQGHVIPDEHITIGEAFKEAGYDTHIVGKWHNDNKSLLRSFDSGDKIMGRGVYLVDHFRMPFWDWDKTGAFKKEDAYVLAYDNRGKEIRSPITKDDVKGPIRTELDGPHTSEVFARHAVQYLKKKEKNNKPFFMYVAFHAPHDPRQAPKAYRDMYTPETIKLPPSYKSQHPFDNGHMFLRDEELAPWPRTKEVAKQHVADYHAIISHLDHQIGKIITALKESGAYENTLIVFAGDSGLAVGNHGLMGKQNIYDEDGIHVPFILSGHLIKNKGRKINALSYIHDIFPTICDMTGVAIPNTVKGKSLVPVIKNKTDQVRNETYHAYKQFQRAYRKGDYKLIEYVRANDNHWQRGEEIRGSRVTQLFNITKDPWEIQDLSFFPEHAKLVAKMKKELKIKAEELGDVKENIEGEIYGFWEFYTD